MKIQRELTQELSFPERRYTTKSLGCTTVYHGSRSDDEVPFYAYFLDDLPIDFTRMEVMWTRPKRIGYFSTESPIFLDRLHFITKRTQIPGLINKWSIIPVRKEGTVIRLSYRQKRGGPLPFADGHTIIIEAMEFRRIIIGIDALVCDPIKRYKGSPKNISL